MMCTRQLGYEVAHALYAWLQPKHMSFEPAWVILEHELAAQIHLTMKQYFQKLKEAEPDNAFRPDTLVRSLLVTCMFGAVPDITETSVDIDSLLAPCWPQGL